MSSKVKILTPTDIKELQILYENHIPYASHINSLFIIYFKWKKSYPDRDYMVFMGLDDEWKKSGTFLMKFKTYNIYVFTLNESPEDLYYLLKESKAFKIEKQLWLMTIYGTRNEHLPAVYKSLEELGIPIQIQVKNKFYWLPKEEALKYTINCPDEVYIKKLNSSHANLICSLWPHSFVGAEEYLNIYLEMNKSFGVFLKENDELAAWILQNCWGTLTVLQTVDKHKRKGYGALVTKKMCFAIAKEGINPLCTIVYGNEASERLFQKLGFKHIGDCTFIEY